MARRRIRGGRIIDPARGIDRVGDLLIDGDKIVGLGEGIEADVEEDIDARGCLVLPAFVEAHCHVREPGREDKETIETAGAAAARSGYVAITAMANTDPINDTASVTRYIIERAREVSPVEVLPVAAVTVGQKGERLTEFGELVEAGAVAFSDDGMPIMNAGIMRRALEYAAPFGVPIITHNEDLDLVQGAPMHEGAWSLELGLKGSPGAAEEVQIARDLCLLRLTGGRIHAAHLSSAYSVQLLNRAKDEQLHMTGEVSPHHLLLTDAAVRSYDTRFKMNPPLRTEEDREALIDGLRDGTIDVIATDHAPHTQAEKELEFDRAPFGVIGLETAFPTCYTRLVEEGHLPLMRLVEAMTWAPAKILGRPDLGRLAIGGPAHVTLVRVGLRETIDSSTFASKSRNTPFDGWEVHCRIERTIVGGRDVFCR